MLDHNNWYGTYLNYLDLPETWNSIEEFSQWYLDNKMPLHIPEDSIVNTSENVFSIIIFRHSRYQVELYLVKPNPSKSTDHMHPGLEVVMCQIGAMSPKAAIGYLTPVLRNGETHNGTFTSPNGAVFLTFERWDEGIPMTSAAVQWKGYTEGPMHDALIRRYYPNAIKYPGYADVSSA